MVVVLATGCGSSGTRNSRATSPVAEPATPSETPSGFVEGLLGELERSSTSGSRHKLLIRGKDRGSVASEVDDITADFVERFRRDRNAALEWAKTKPELRTAVLVAPRVTSARLEYVQSAFSLRLYERDDPIEDEHPHVALLISGARLFVAVEALEGFAY